MTNSEIIFASACAFLGIDEATGGDLLLSGRFPIFHTYQTWKASGFQVQKGQKAAFTARIWKMTVKNTEDGKIEKLILKDAYFFSRSQVEPIQ